MHHTLVRILLLMSLYLLVKKLLHFLLSSVFENKNRIRFKKNSFRKLLLKTILAKSRIDTLSLRRFAALSNKLCMVDYQPRSPQDKTAFSI
ncbi:hypothetical protein QL285_025584 [Trifolium repens]|nr:hypothetical protein QL285_025584 [Trifolium repens]